VSSPETAPKTVGPIEEFQRFLNRGSFMLQKSRASGAYVFYPRTLEPGSGSNDLEWVPTSGRGVVYACTTIRRKAERGGDFNVSIVQLDEGPRLTTRVLGIAPASVRIGLRVTAKIEAISWRIKTPEQRVVVFYPEE
jgi:uncharacterized OB-fold protein